MRNGALEWMQPAALRELGAQEAQVWLVRWREGDFARDGAWLNAAERERAAAFRFAKDREAFSSARVALRRLLGANLGCAPSAVELAESPLGKPVLSGGAGGLHFNVSHSGEVALVAIARCEVGVDVERCRAEVDGLGLARRFFAQAEQAAILEAEGDARREVFYRCWVRKEACVKAVGHGLRLELDRFVVPTGQELGPTVVQLPLAEAGAVVLLPLPPIAGYACALAARGATPSVRYELYPETSFRK